MPIGTEVFRIVVEMTARNLDLVKTKVSNTLEGVNNKVRTTAMANERFMSNFSKIMKLPLEKFRDLNKIAKMTPEQFKRFSKSMDPRLLAEYGSLLGSLNTRGGRFANRVRLLTHGMRGFRMELLSVMFFGMGLYRFFTSLLAPAAKLAGVFDVINMILEFFFLPIILLLLDPLLDLLDFILSLDEGTREFWGKIVLLGAAFGLLLLVIGMVGLGIGGLINGFASFLGIIRDSLPEPLGDISAAFIGLPLAITGTTVAFKGLGLAEGIISGIWNKVKESKSIKSLLKSLGIEIDENKSIWESLFDTVSSVIEDTLDRLGLGETEIGKTFDDIKAGLEEMGSNFTETFGGLQDAFDEIDTKELLDEFGKLTSKASDLINLIIEKDLIGTLTEVADAFLEISDAIGPLIDLIKAYTSGVKGAYKAGRELARSKRF